MSWNPSKAHIIDLMMMDAAAKLFPRHTISVTNRWGVTVCGLTPPESMDKVRMIERAEHQWEIA